MIQTAYTSRHSFVNRLKKQIYFGFSNFYVGESSPSKQRLARRVERGCTPLKSHERSEVAQ